MKEKVHSFYLRLLSDKEILELLYMYFIRGVYFVSLFTVPLVIGGYFENEFYAFQVSSLNTRPDFFTVKLSIKGSDIKHKA